MTDFLDRLERQLVQRAREGIARAPRRRRTLAFAVVAAVAVLSVPAAAVTGVFSAPDHPPNGPGLVDLNPPCVQKNPPQGRTTTAPPPAAITRSFAIFRRAQVPADRLPADRLGLFMMDGVNPDFVRRVTSSNGLHAYLIPALNINFHPVGGGKGPGCAQLVHPDMKPKPGICLRLPAAGGSCSPVDGILTGKSLLTEGGSTHGRTLAAGIVPDGVKAVIWRVRRGSGFLDTRIPVRDNVYIGRFPGRKGHGLYVYFVDAKGRHLVIGPPHLTSNQRAQRRRDAKLDQAAGPTPSVDPAVGGTRTLFVLRMRVRKPDGRYVYAVTVTGRQPGACTKPYRYKIGMVPGSKGAERGLMRAAFGPGPGYAHWCPGTYHGTVRRQRGRSWKATGPVVGRFQFTVR
ncbi:MAG TPA: hypothetical protein VE570_12705 [Thermoleophilaceae bacterium]|nr:hypothetical protein [Thermoleophilaceae bacterium]